MNDYPKWPDPTSAEGKIFFANADSIFSAFKTLGYRTLEAIGALANAEAESSLDPQVGGDNGTAKGLWQLHDDRTSDIKDKIGIDFTIVPLPSIQDQVKAADWELKTYPYFGFKAIKAATHAGDAARAWCVNFERPMDPGPDSDKRAFYAERWTLYFAKKGF